MSGFLPQPDGLEYDIATAPPVLIQHGSEDPLIPVSQGREAARILAEAAAPVVYLEYPMGHQVALESMADAAIWVERILAGERPSAPVEVEVPELKDEDALVPSVRTEDFEQVVMKSDVPVIVDFWAPWCQPCLAVAPVVEQIAAMRAGSYKVVKVNIDEEPALAQTFNVQSIPMVALFRNGRMERTSVGAKPRPSLEADLGMLVIP
jgi:thioredoxin 1